MAVTVGQFAYAIQASADGTSLLPELSERLSRLLGTATATVELLAAGAPDEVKDSAVIAMGAYLFDQPPAGRHSSFANAFHNSGAGSLLAYWTQKGFADSAGAVISSTPGGIGTGGLSEAEALALIVAWAHEGNDDPIPASKLSLGGGVGLDDAAVQALIETHAAMIEVHHRRSSSAGIVNVEDGRLASSAGTVMRIGWSESQAYDEVIFTRAGNHPDDGAAVGTIAGVFPPVQPTLPAIPDVAENEKYLHIWVGEIPGNVAQLTFFGSPAHGVSAAAAQTYNTTDGTWWVTNLPLSPGISAYAFSAVVVGALIASQPYVDAAIAAIPTPTGGFPMTRTQVFSFTAVAGSVLSANATEPWLPNHLYELILGPGTRTRHIFLTNASGLDGLQYPVTDLPESATNETPYVTLFPNIGALPVTFIQLNDTVDGRNVTMIVNKLT